MPSSWCGHNHESYEAHGIGPPWNEDRESEDYLYPADFFVAIELPKEAAPVFTAAQS